MYDYEKVSVESLFVAMNLVNALKFDYKKYNQTKNNPHEGGRYFGMPIIDIYLKAIEFKRQNTLKIIEEGGFPQVVRFLLKMLPSYVWVTCVHLLLIMIYCTYTPAEKDLYANKQMKMLAHMSQNETLTTDAEMIQAG
jgi:hypothetical protein